jgi:hypothetical protein
MNVDHLVVGLVVTVFVIFGVCLASAQIYAAGARKR